ncbi:MAG: hypothetical protein ACKO7W_14055 [Elainella sp.]
MTGPPICFLSGASGVSKTTLVQALAARYPEPSWAFLNFDSIGVPTLETMIELAGSGERWQTLATETWIAKIVAEYQDRRLVVIEGQTNLDWINAACDKFDIDRYLIVLITCDWPIMQKRLIQARQQPELVTPEINRWAAFLYRQAKQQNWPIVDTSHQALAETVDAVYTLIRRNFERT